jgi:hypothetical protein
MRGSGLEALTTDRWNSPLKEETPFLQNPRRIRPSLGDYAMAGGELRDGQPRKPGNYVTADHKISMCSEPVRRRWRGCEVVHAHHRLTTLRE